LSTTHKNENPIYSKRENDLYRYKYIV